MVINPHKARHVSERERFEHADIPKLKAEAVVIRGDGRLNVKNTR